MYACMYVCAKYAMSHEHIIDLIDESWIPHWFSMDMMMDEDVQLTSHWLWDKGHNDLQRFQAATLRCRCWPAIRSGRIQEAAKAYEYVGWYHPTWNPDHSESEWPHPCFRYGQNLAASSQGVAKIKAKHFLSHEKNPMITSLLNSLVLVANYPKLLLQLVKEIGFQLSCTHKVQLWLRRFEGCRRFLLDGAIPNDSSIGKARFGEPPHKHTTNGCSLEQTTSNLAIGQRGWSEVALAGKATLHGAAHECFDFDIVLGTHDCYDNMV